MTFSIEKLRLENERLQNAAEGKNNNSFLENFVRMPEGKGYVDVRFLPARPGSDNLFLTTRIHKLKDRNIHCPKNLVGDRWVGDCPICTHYNWLWKQVDKLVEEGKANEQMIKDGKVKEAQEARAIKPQERIYCNVVARRQLDKNGIQQENVGPLILSIGKKLYTKIVYYIIGDVSLGKKGLGEVWDMKTGRDFRIVKTIGLGGYPNYDTSEFASESSPAGNPDQCEKWLSSLHDLTSLRMVKPFAELDKELKVYMGLETNDNFSPGRLQTSNGQTNVQTPVPVVATTNDGSAVVPDDEFLQELNDM